MLRLTFTPSLFNCRFPIILLKNVAFELVSVCVNKYLISPVQCLPKSGKQSVKKNHFPSPTSRVAIFYVIEQKKRYWIKNILFPRKKKERNESPMYYLSRWTTEVLTTTRESRWPALESSGDRVSRRNLKLVKNDIRFGSLESFTLNPVRLAQMNVIVSERGSEPVYRVILNCPRYVLSGFTSLTATFFCF